MTPILSATILRTQSDARLAVLARQGHERAFEAIVERYRKPLYRYVRRMLPEARTEDAIQQTFLKAWSAIREGVEVNDLRPWLYRIAHNTALDALKKAGYDYDELSDALRSSHSLESDVERRAVIRQTLAGVANLPERQREVLLRLAVDGHSRAQVASDLGLTDGAVRQLAHRARATLRAAATAMTPIPAAAWAAKWDRAGEPITQRIVELAAGGGAAGGASVILKGGAAIVAVGVLAAGPVALEQGRAPSDRDAIAADGPKQARSGTDDAARGGETSASSGEREASSAASAGSSRRSAGNPTAGGSSHTSGPSAPLSRDYGQSISPSYALSYPSGGSTSGSSYGDSSHGGDTYSNSGPGSSNSGPGSSNSGPGSYSSGSGSGSSTSDGSGSSSGGSGSGETSGTSSSDGGSSGSGSRDGGGSSGPG